MAAWPDGTALATRVSKGGTTAAAATTEHDEAVAAAISRIVELTSFEVASTEIPDAVRQATLIEAHRIFRRPDTPEGVLGFGDQGTAYIARIDVDAASLIRPWRKTPLAFA